MKKAMEYYADTILDFIVYGSMAVLLTASFLPTGTITTVFNAMFDKMKTYTT